MKYSFTDVEVTICGIPLRSFADGDVIVLDDPWEPPLTKRQRMRARCMLLKWTMRMRKRMGLLPIPGIGFRGVEGEWDAAP